MVLPVLLVLLGVLLSACQAASQASQPETTRRATYTPLVVKTAIPAAKTYSPGANYLTQPPAEGPATLPPAGTKAMDKSLHFILVQHARCARNASWCPIEQGILDAARELNVNVMLLGPGSEDLPGNIEQMAALIDRAVAAQPDGIALTINDPVSLREPILRAIASSIPVIAYHDGSGPIQDDLPYLTYLGMDNYQGGYQGALRLIQAGARAGVCIQPALAQTAFQTRCKGYQAAFIEAGLNAQVLNTPEQADEALNELHDYAQNHPEVNAYLTTDFGSAPAFYTWLKAPGRGPEKILHGSFDLNDEIRAHITSGDTLFAIDQQAYLQGYEAVFWLTMIDRFGFTPATPVTVTGPHFVDKTTLHSQANPERPVKLIFIQHALCSWDTYWCVVERGIRDAAQEQGVSVEILGPGAFDLDQMAVQIDHAVAARPDGLGVTVPDPEALHAPILRAIQAGYPVIAYDSGTGPVKDDLPYLTFIGVDNDAEYRGGYLAALRLIHAGGRAGVCINHQVGHASLDARCQGMVDAFTNEGREAAVLDCGRDAGSALQIIQDYAQSHEQVNAFLTMGAGDPGAVSVYRYLEKSNRARGEVLHGTFDLSPEVVKAIEDGTSLFAVDGQPYLQGYSAVMFLTLALRQDIWPAESITSTGPGFVDLNNIAIVKQMAGIYR